MAFEIVQVVADGVLYEGWESCEITVAMDLAYAFAQIATTEVGGIKDLFNSAFDKWNFPPGTPIKILATGTPMYAGVVSLYAPTVDATQHAISVLARTFGVEMVYSSVKHPTGNFENMTDIDVVQKLAEGTRATISNYTKPDLIPYWQIQQGAPIYQEQMRILQPRAKMLWADLSGANNITAGSSFGFIQGSALIQGVNIEKMSGRMEADGWELLHVVGQFPRGTDEHIAYEPFGVAHAPIPAVSPGGGLSSPGIFQFPYKRIIDQQATTQELAQRRADIEMNRSACENLQVQVTVPGWRDGGTSGDFWKVNTDVYIYAPWLKVDCVLRIYKTVFKQNAVDGTVTDLLLVDGRCVGDAAGSKCNSGSVWQWLPYEVTG